MKRIGKSMTRVAAAVLSIIIMAGMMPALPAHADTISAEDKAVLEEIGAQLSDDSIDSFDFVTGKSMRAMDSADYPESFDLRDVDGRSYVTSVKFQNPFGSCWGFAAIAAAETSVLGNDSIRGSETADTLDLSEKHLVWFAYNSIKDENNPQYGEGAYYTYDKSDSEILGAGGVPYNATSLFSQGMGPASENQKEDGLLEYHGKEKTVVKDANGNPYCYSADDDWSLGDEDRFLQSYRLKESYLLPSPAKSTDFTAAINAIKEQLYNKRAVEIGFCADSSKPEDDSSKTKYISSSWAHYTYDSNARANHAVTIVGWDDNYSRDNFAHKTESGEDAPTPEGDGAWLVKNSWGSGENEFPDKGSGSWGIVNDEGVHTGYFWLSYYDKSINMVEALEFDVSNVDDVYYICQHDYMPVDTAFAARLSNESKMANIFEAEFPTVIEQVTCQTSAPGTAVNYSIYIMNDGASDPTDGERIFNVTETYKYGGFHKVTLPKRQTINTGERFALVVTQKISGTSYYSVNVNYSSNENYAKQKGYRYYSKGVVNAGESLLYTGSKWLDLSDESVQNIIFKGSSVYYDVDNFPIKAYVTMDGEAAMEEAEKLLSEAEELTSDENLKDAVDAALPVTKSYSEAAATAGALAKNAAQTLAEADITKAAASIDTANALNETAASERKKSIKAYNDAGNALAAAYNAVETAEEVSGFDADAAEERLEACEERLTAARETLYAMKSQKEAADKKLDAASGTLAEARLDAEFNGVRDTNVPALKGFKAKAAKKSIKLSWKKAAAKKLKKFDKIELQYSKSGSFLRTETTSKLISKKKTASTINKLKKGTYYVRIRAVKNTTGIKHVSAWSKAKKIKVK